LFDQCAGLPIVSHILGPKVTNLWPLILHPFKSDRNHATAPGEPASYDEAALALGLKSVRAWTDLLTCAPLRHAARLMLTPDQQRLLDWIAQGDAADHEGQDPPAP